MTRTKIATRKDGSHYEYTTSRPITLEVAKRRFIQLYGGICTACGVVWPSYKVTYDVGDEKQGAKRIERYCFPCYEKVKDGLTR